MSDSGSKLMLLGLAAVDMLDGRADDLDAGAADRNVLDRGRNDLVAIVEVASAHDLDPMAALRIAPFGNDAERAANHQQVEDVPGADDEGDVGVVGLG